MKNLLKVLRAERDWSQARLAEELDASRRTINAFETGKYDPSLPLAFKVAAVFEKPIEDIFFRKTKGANEWKRTIPQNVTLVLTWPPASQSARLSACRLVISHSGLLRALFLGWYEASGPDSLEADYRV